MTRMLVSVVGAVVLGVVQLMAVDLEVPMALQGSGEWQVVAPANTTSYQVVIPYDPDEWTVPGHHLRLELFDGDGHDLGAMDIFDINIDKQTGLPGPHFFNLVMGIEREDIFPADRRPGRTKILNGVHYRQVLIVSPLVVRMTVDDGAPGAEVTYGVSVTLGTKGG